MQGFINKLEKLLMPLANIVSSNKYLLAMRDSFSSLIPFIVGGSFFGIFNWVIFEPEGTILGELGLNLGKVFTGLEGEAYLNSGFVEICRNLQSMCGAVVTVTFGIFSLLLVLTFGYRLAKMWKNEEPFIAAALALVSYLLITPAKVIGESGDIIDAFSTSYFGSSAVLTAIIATTFVVWFYCKLTKNEKIKIKMPESVPPAVANSFAVLIPVVVVLFVVTLFQSILTWIGEPALNDILYAALQAPLMGFSQGLGFSLIYQFLVWFFWWFGIHGHNVTAVIQNLVYMPAQLANQAGEASYIFSNGFFEAGLCHVIALPIAIFIASKRDDWRAISKVGLPAMIFNVQEPLAFGIPIVLNPLLLIPYVLNPMINTVLGMLLIEIGLMPVFRYVVPWTMPAFFGGLVGTGSIMGGVYQLLCIAINVVIYIPFVIAGNAQYKNEQQAEPSAETA
ncbi:PTS system cellobiose-specific IIC component [Breznakia sp. PF5-3]|uniref:PTS sugar transporter subunit IIC n=1 Tax=unclassified Breznakia TaxID=2623764 RepID=UPI0024051CB0|nr:MULTISPECIES: PTS transporter subunit EIIC [unclassified Breznakia]MDL2276572.1 PTS transporter subunit EIIC [Breznakia sp. OttesenSCG-928-G09]MDF9823858.1 PTS system cellobiose-specific IIC component [Breznakia sp. PM6-1]MDF9834576.1 PTS system cellobiose-specific IIC component [Breznakia sp. PF5-3]MDF9836807.1 PTS system cellobiose-specific IIC component [Breznakia sp. PFB2-8]MDF9858744.1 PTS system cellobiose-specific IIC component [Breznakia sp. PH5-24]